MLLGYKEVVEAERKKNKEVVQCTPLTAPSPFLVDVTTLGVLLSEAGVLNAWKLDKHYQDCFQL